MDDSNIIWGLQIVKAYQDADERFVEGIATTDDRDVQGEIVVPEGLDCSYLAKAGKLKWDHGGKPADFIGVIVDYRKSRHELWIKSRLYKGLKEAEDAWTILQNKDHGLGFSIEGAVVKRDPKDQTRIVHAEVRHIALTAQPVNTKSFARICKSFAEPGEIQKTLETSYSVVNQTGGQALVPESPYGITDVTGPKLEAARKTFELFWNGVRGGALRVIDGTAKYFELHGLDSHTAKFLADYVKEHCASLVAKSIGGNDMANANPLEELEKSLDSVTKSAELSKGGDPEDHDDAGMVTCPKCGTKCKAGSVCPKCGAKVEAGGSGGAGGDKDGDLVKCAKCGEMVKKGETCSKCNAPLKKAVDDGGDDGGGDEPVLLDVTPLIEELHKGMSTTVNAQSTLAKALLRSHEENVRLDGKIELLQKSVNGLMDKLTELGKVPAERRMGVAREKGLGGDGKSEATAEEKNKFQKALMSGQIPGTYAILVDRKHATEGEVLKALGL